MVDDESRTSVNDIKIVVVAAQEFLRDSLVFALMPTMPHSSHATSLNDLRIRIARGQECDLVILATFDLQNDLEELSKISAELPDLDCVILTDRSALCGSQGYPLCVKGFLGFNLPTGVIVAALQLVANGHTIWPRLTRQHLPSSLGRSIGTEQRLVEPSLNQRSEAIDLRSKEQGLSPRERDVLRLAASGYSNKRVADILNIADTTVRIHMRSVLRKLGAESRTQAVIFALQLGMRASSVQQDQRIPPS